MNNDKQNKARHHRYDWVLDHLKSNARLKSSPYLWTRIKAHLESQKRELPEQNPFLKYSVLLQRALPLILLVTISIGIFIGYKLSSDILHYTKPGKGPSEKILKEYEQTLVPEDSRDLNLSPLNVQVADE